MPTPEEVLEFAAANNIRWLNLQFVDVYGNLNKTTMNIRDLTDDMFSNGISCGDLMEVYGWSEDGELLLRPDADTYGRVPWEASVLRLICDVIVAKKKERFLKDPRCAAERAEVNAKAMGISSITISPQMEFYVFDAVTVDKVTPGRGPNYLVDAREAPWNPSPMWNAKKGAYLDQPYDSLYSARAQVSEVIEDNFRYLVDKHYHGRSPSSQESLTLKHSPLKTSADATLTTKFVVRNLAFIANSAPTFMPLPIFNERGSSLCLHQILWKGNENLFYDGNESYAQMSQNARYYIGGLLEHASAITLFTNPTTNSYKRLLQDPHYIAWGNRNNGAAVVVPNDKKNDRLGKGVLYTVPDPAANPYLAYAVMVAAGLDGLKNKKDPGDPVDDNISKMKTKERKEKGVKYLPSSLIDAIDELESDNKFMKGVISSELLGALLESKIEEQKEHNVRTSAYEFEKYFNL